MTGLSPRVYSWGANSFGQLAQGHGEDVLEPREVTQLPDKVSSITGGGAHTLALTDGGTILSCGSNERGQAGNDEMMTLTPVGHLETTRITKAVGGWDFSVALTVDGCLFSWGSNAFGQLGCPTKEKQQTIPVPVKFPDNEKIVDMSAGLRHVVAVSSTGRVFTWGQGRKGQLGVAMEPKMSIIEEPTEVFLAGSSCPKQAIAGSYHTAILTDSGEIFCWGDNKYGQMVKPPNTFTQQSVPQQVKSEMFGGRTVTSLYSGWTHLLACTDDGTVWSWGRADYGQLGRSCDQSHDFTPRPVENLQGVKEIACGAEHSLAVDSNGGLWSLGWNEHGMCGTGDEVNVKIPHKVAALTEHKVNHIGSGAGHCLAIV